MAGQTQLSAKSLHPRMGWCFEVLKVGSDFELHIFKRKHNGSVEIYSPSGSRSGTKVPFGQIKNCEFLVGQNSKTKMITESFQLTNEDNRKGVFDLNILDMFLKEQNKFTGKCGQLIVEKKFKLLSLYLSLLVRSKSFSSYNSDTHNEQGFRVDGGGIQAEDLSNEQGSVMEYMEILSVAGANAELSDAPSLPRKRKITEYFGTEAAKKKKMNKEDVIQNHFAEELVNDLGVEKMHTVAYEGRADIPIGNLSVSPLLGLPVDQAKVLSIQRDMLDRYNPAKATLTVSPIDGSSVDLKNISTQKFHVIHGIHSFLAMQNLHAKGKYSDLLGVNNDLVLCFVVNLANKPDGHNYANIRNNEIDSKNQTLPTVHMLVYIYKKLMMEYKDGNQAAEAIESIARLMMIPADDLTAVRKICHWPEEALATLVTVLLKFEKYATLDGFSPKAKGSMKLGKPLKLTKAMFRAIGKFSPKFFVENAEAVLNSEISLESLVENSGKIQAVEKANTSLLQLSTYTDVETLNVQYPGKFAPEIIKKYAGADVWGKNKNRPGERLESYFKSVVQNKGEPDLVNDPVVTEEYASFRDVTRDMLEENDIVVIKFKNLGLDYAQYLIDSAGSSFKETFAILILSASGEEQKKVLGMAHLWEEKAEFSATQILFMKNISTEGNFGFVENVQFSVLLGKVRNFGANIPVLQEGLKDSLTSVLDRLCPNNGKVAVVIGPKTPIPFIDHESGAWTRLKYYGDKVAVKKLNQRLMKVNVTAPDSDEAVLDDGTSENTVEEPQSLAQTSQGRNDVKDRVGDGCDGDEGGDMDESGDEGEGGDVYEFNEEVKCLTKQSSTSKF